MVGLCIVAGIAVYQNVIESTMDSSLPASMASTPSPTAPAPITLAPTQMVHDEIATQWIDHPARDPFAPLSHTTWPKASSRPITASTDPTHKLHPSAPKNLMLKAVALEAQQRSAVINRQVVYEGEEIEGYQVISIQLQGVLLTRHGKKRFLTFATNPTS